MADNYTLDELERYNRGELSTEEENDLLARVGGTKTVTVEPIVGAAPTMGGVEEEPLDLMALARQVEKEKERAIAQTPTDKASPLELATIAAKGAGTGMVESGTSLFGLPALAEMGVSAVGAIPENVQRIRDFLAVATPEQRAELFSAAGGQAGSLLASLIPGGAYTQERLASESPTVQRALGLLPPATPEQAYREETGKSLEEASALRRLYENISTTLGTGARMAFPALKVADILLPETRREAEMLGKEVGQAVGPTVALGATKKISRAAGKAASAISESKLADKVLNIGQNKNIELSRIARGTGTVANTLRVLKRTIDRERKMWWDADRYQEKFLKEYDNILGGVDTSVANESNIIRDVLGDSKKPGAFRTYIDRQKAQKENLLQTAQEKVKQQEIAKLSDDINLKVNAGELSAEDAAAAIEELNLRPAESFGAISESDFNFGKFDELKKLYEKSEKDFPQEQVKAFRDAAESLKNDIKGRPGRRILDFEERPSLSPMAAREFTPPRIKTISDMRDYIQLIDKELETLGYFDDKTWAMMGQDPSLAATVAAKTAALKATRDVVLDAQKRKLQTLLGPKAMKDLEDLNEKIAMGIEYQNIFARALPMTQENLAKVSGSSLNRYVQDQGVVRGLIKSGEEALFPGEEMRASIFEQRDLLRDLGEASRMARGETPIPINRRIAAEALGEAFQKGAAPMTPEQLATTAGLGYTSAIAPENQAQAAEIPASLLQLLSQPQPPMTPATPGAMAPASLLQTLAQPGAEGEGMGESLVPGADAANEMQQVQGADFIQQMSGQPGPGLAGPEMPQTPEAPPMEPIQGMLGGLPPMGGAGQMAEGPSLMAAERKPFKPVKPTMDNVIDNAGAIAREITSLLGPEDANNVLQQLQEAIQSKNDMAVGKVVTAFTKAYPEAQNIFEDEFPDMPIFTFNGKIYQPDDRQAYEKWLTQTNASSIEKAKSLSALNTDGTVRLPKGR